MKLGTLLMAVSFVFVLPINGLAMTRYVDVSSPNPTAPYTNWTTAANVLQDAVDLCIAGDLVLVANGTYDKGGRAAKDGLTNRIAISRPITVRSLDGPKFTFICGSPDPYSFFGENSVRCALLENGARLEGFTLTNGVTSLLGNGGGAFCFVGTLSNCIVTKNYAHAVGGGVYGGTIISCILTNNSAGYSGGGVEGSVVRDCVIINNSAGSGGGVAGSVVRDCVIINNSAESGGGGAAYCDSFDTKFVGNQAWSGGGVVSGTHINCTFEGNQAGNIGGGVASDATTAMLKNCFFLNNTAGNYGGGAYGCILEACRFSGNTASFGGGASECILQNCVLTGNRASYGGGAAADLMEASTNRNIMRNCTVAYNTAEVGGGILGHMAYNSIIIDNTASQQLNCSSSTNINCCTYPMPNYGSNNITSSPEFLDADSGKLQLQSNSPCINAGANRFVQSTLDLAGNARIFGRTVDIGAYEYSLIDLSPFQLWLQSFGLPTDGSADYIDSDQDGFNNADEWVCSTNPTNRLSRLQMLNAERTDLGWTVTWKSVARVKYILERAPGDGLPLKFVVMADNIQGSEGVTTFLDANNFSSIPVFFRVGVAR